MLVDHSEEDDECSRGFIIAPGGEVDDRMSLSLWTADTLRRDRSSKRLDVSIFNTSASGGGSGGSSSVPLWKRHSGELPSRACEQGQARQEGGGRQENHAGG